MKLRDLLRQVSSAQSLDHEVKARIIERDSGGAATRVKVVPIEFVLSATRSEVQLAVESDTIRHTEWEAP